MHIINMRLENSNLEHIKFGITEKLHHVQEVATDAQTLIAMQEEKIRMLSQTPADFLKNIDAFISLDTALQSHIVTVQNLFEFNALLEAAGADQITAMDTVAHENAHLNVAESLGFKASGYSLLVSKGEHGFAYTPIANYEVPHTLNTKDTVEANIAIAQAPEKYGNKLAPDDIERIETLSAQLKDL